MLLVGCDGEERLSWRTSTVGSFYAHVSGEGKKRAAWKEKKKTYFLERAPFRERELVVPSAAIRSLRGVRVPPSPSSSRAPRLRLLVDELFWSAEVDSKAPRLRRPFSYIERGA